MASKTLTQKFVFTTGAFDGLTVGAFVGDVGALLIVGLAVTAASVVCMTVVADVVVVVVVTEQSTYGRAKHVRPGSHP